MNNKTTTSNNSNDKHCARRMPQNGVIQPSYGRYGGYYGIITGVDNKFFSTKSKAKEWFDKLGVTPIYC